MINKEKLKERIILLMGTLKANAFAKKCGVDPKTIRKAINGEIIGRASLEKIAEKNDKSVGWLIGEIDESIILKNKGTKTEEERSKYVQKQKRNDKEIFYKKAAIHFEEFFDWIYDDIGNDAKSIKAGFSLLEEGCPDYRQWCQDVNKTKQTGTDN